MNISLFTVAIPVNYITEFRELLEATTYVFIYVVGIACTWYLGLIHRLVFRTEHDVSGHGQVSFRRWRG
jgi:hypothetical protein